MMAKAGNGWGDCLMYDEILVLTDEEVRIKASELAGWWCLGEENWRSLEGKSVRAVTWRDPSGYIAYSLVPPDYINDIAAALELTDSLSQLVITKLIGRWRIEWFDGVGGREIEDERLPRALTLAFVAEESGL